MPDTNRPEVTVIDGMVYVFVGGAWQRMSPESAEKLRAQIDDALKKISGACS